MKILRDETAAEHRERFVARSARDVASSRIRRSSVTSALAAKATDSRFSRWSGSKARTSRSGCEGDGLAAGDAIAHADARGRRRSAAAHARGIVHRDIKPSNLFLVDGDVDRVKVLDFGIAHMQEAGAGMTRTGAAIGTPRYMAPEQARGRRDFDARADVFSLGCVLFECLTGHPPFEGDSPGRGAHEDLARGSAAARCHLYGRFPTALDDLVARMIAKDPEARPSRWPRRRCASSSDTGPIEGIGIDGGTRARLGRHDWRAAARVASCSRRRQGSVRQPPPLETAPTVASDPMHRPLDDSAVMKDLTRSLGGDGRGVSRTLRGPARRHASL